MPYWKTAVVVLVCAVVVWVLITFTLSALAKKPDNLGVNEGRLTACPPSPNCVCSQDEDAQQGEVTPHQPPYAANRRCPWRHSTTNAPTATSP